jgi:hypothetical protein
MKKIILPIASIFLLSCNAATNANHNYTQTAPFEIARDTSTLTKDATAQNKALDSKPRNVKYYYDMYANVDSEDPTIGVGPREIIEQDLESGIISYKGSDGKICIIKVWHVANYDVIDYVGGVILVQGNKEFVPAIAEKINQLLKTTIDNRTARGGECTYAQNPIIEVIDGKVLLQLTCTDDATFKQTLAEITIANGALQLK